MTATVRDYQAWLAFLAERGRQPFVWGQNDCVLCAAGAVQAQTGKDPLAGMPTWSSEEEARAILADLGGLEVAVSKVLAPIHPSQAHRGDVAGVPSENGDLLLMIVEGRTLVGPADPSRPGLQRLPRSAMTKAWSTDQWVAADPTDS